MASFSVDDLFTSQGQPQGNSNEAMPVPVVPNAVSLPVPEVTGPDTLPKESRFSFRALDGKTLLILFGGITAVLIAVFVLVNSVKGGKEDDDGTDEGDAGSDATGNGK